MDNELPGPPAPAPTATTDSPTTTDPPTTTPTATTHLRRSRDDRMLGGVCGGIAATLDIDAAVLRIALVAATVLGFGAGVVIYLACWLLIPEA